MNDPNITIMQTYPLLSGVVVSPLAARYKRALWMFFIALPYFLIYLWWHFYIISTVRVAKLGFIFLMGVILSLYSLFRGQGPIGLSTQSRTVSIPTGKANPAKLLLRLVIYYAVLWFGIVRATMWIVETVINPYSYPEYMFDSALLPYLIVATILFAIFVNGNLLIRNKFGQSLLDQVTGTLVIALYLGRDSQTQSIELWAKLRPTWTYDKQAVEQARRALHTDASGTLAPTPGAAGVSYGAAPGQPASGFAPAPSQQGFAPAPTNTTPVQAPRYPSPSASQPASGFAPAPPAPPPHTTWRIEANDGTVIHLQHGVLLGRDPVALPEYPQAALGTFLVPDRELSKTHCYIHNLGNEIRIEDLDSTNGVEIEDPNGHTFRVRQPHVIHQPAHTRVMIGSKVLVFHLLS